MSHSRAALSTQLVGNSQLTVVNQHLRYRRDEVSFPDKTTGTYTYIDDDYAAAATVPLTQYKDELSVLLILIERYPSGTIGWEVPCGRPEADETQRQAAERELAEEARLSGKLWQQLPRQVENVGRGNSRSDVFLVADLSSLTEQKADSTEVILDRGWFSMRQIDELVCSGKISAGHTMSCLLAAQAFLRCQPQHPISLFLGV